MACLIAAQSFFYSYEIEPEMESKGNESNVPDVTESTRGISVQVLSYQ